MAEHIIKCWPQQFWAIRSGLKTFEYRKNDRGYRVGDTLIIREFDPATGAFSGADERRTITHMLAGGFGLPEGYAVLGLGDCPPPSSHVVAIQEAAKALPGVEGIGATYVREIDAWRLYTMPGAKPFGSIDGYSRDLADWVINALRVALHAAPPSPAPREGLTDA